MPDPDIVDQLHSVVVDGVPPTVGLAVAAANEIETLRGTHLCWAEVVALLMQARPQQEEDIVASGNATTKYAVVLRILAQIAKDKTIEELLAAADEIVAQFARKRSPTTVASRRTRASLAERASE